MGRFVILFLIPILSFAGESLTVAGKWLVQPSGAKTPDCFSITAANKDARELPGNLFFLDDSLTIWGAHLKHSIQDLKSWDKIGDSLANSDSDLSTKLTMVSDLDFFASENTDILNTKKGNFLDWIFRKDAYIDDQSGVQVPQTYLAGIIALSLNQDGNLEMNEYLRTSNRSGETISQKHICHQEFIPNNPFKLALIRYAFITSKIQSMMDFNSHFHRQAECENIEKHIQALIRYKSEKSKSTNKQGNAN